MNTNVVPLLLVSIVLLLFTTGYNCTTEKKELVDGLASKQSYIDFECPAEGNITIIRVGCIQQNSNILAGIPHKPNCGIF